MIQQHRQHPEQLLKMFRLRVAKLHKQAAILGPYVPDYIQIEIQHLQKEIALLEAEITIAVTSSSDAHRSMRRRCVQFVLLPLLAALLLVSIFAVPYLRLRLYTEATLWALPPPATARQVDHEMDVDVRCGRVVSTTLYQADSTWADLKTQYTTQFQQSGWFIQPSESAVIASWRFQEPHNQDTPNLIISIHPQSFLESVVPQQIDRSTFEPREERYVILLEYIGDQRGYRSCFHD